MVGENFHIYDVQITENAFASQIITMCLRKNSPQPLTITTPAEGNYPAGIYLLKVNNRNTKT